MANDLEVLVPIVAARALRIFRGQLTMPQLVNRDYQDEASTPGDVINIPLPGTVGTRAVEPSHEPIEPEDHTVEKVQVPLDQWRQTDPIHLTDKEMVEINRSDFLPPRMAEGIAALAKECNQYLMGRYRSDDRGVYATVGTAGTTPFGTGVEIASAINVRKALNMEDVPTSNRRGILDVDADAEALSNDIFVKVNESGANIGLIEGNIGRKFGVDWFWDNDTPTHTAGSEGDATISDATDGTFDAGEYTVDLKGLAGATGSINEGDILSFEGHTGNYCVVANPASARWSTAERRYVASSNEIADLKVWPALRENVGNEEDVTILDDHVVNLVFHRDAFVFAMRPLQTTEGLGNLIQAVNDPLTGISFRLEVERQHKQNAWSFDVLYGGKLVRPEAAVRLLG